MKKAKKITRVRGASWEPKIIYRSNRQKWMVDCGFKFGPDKRIRQHFDTEPEAVAWAANKKTEYLTILAGRKQEEKQGTYARLSSLTDTQRKHIVNALTKVDGDTYRIIRALEYYERHTTLADASRKLIDVHDEYIKAKEISGKRARTIRDAKGKLAPFVKALGNTTISLITTTDVEGWLNEKGYISTTRNAYRTALSGLFKYAVKRRYIEYNPVTAIETVTVDQGLPAIHTVAQVKAILKAGSDFIPSRIVVAARDQNRKVTERKEQIITDPDQIRAARASIVPYLAIGYFAGLRPENELVNLDWKDIDFESRTIRVDPATAKKRRQRYVDMSDNLIRWLTPYAMKEGKIGFSRAIFRTIRETSGVEWSKDVMRHSFGSYLLAHNEDAPKTSLQMGHTRVDVLFNNYRNLVKKTAAAEYWSIMPETNTPSAKKQ